MSRMSVIDSSVDTDDESGEAGAAGGNTIVPVITISSEEMKAFYNKEFDDHKKTKQALRAAQKKNKELETKLGDKQQSNKWAQFHKDKVAPTSETKAAEPKSPFRTKPIR